jgi:hypothetical protein
VSSGPGRPTSPPTQDERSRRPWQRNPLVWLPLAPILLLLALSSLPQVRSNPRLAWSFWGAATLLLGWQLGLAYRSIRRGRERSFRLHPAPAHYVQAMVQLCIFAYWGWYWRPVYEFAALIAAQLAFAYAFDALLCWSRRESWRLGFGPFPIIFSTNLFLWFKDDWFFLQFLMVAVGMLGKELVSWTLEGRRAHIFNPSALSLFLFSIALIATDSTELTWGEEIATTLGRPGHIYLQIFLLGLVVQYLFSVTLVTLSAAAILCLLNLAYTGATGVYYFFDSNIPIAVFLGLHLLVTDPSTSPRTNWGRLLFGAIYGAGVFGMYGVLEWMGAPRFYDKLLCVPLLNLAVQQLDRIGRWPRLARLGPGALEARRVNLIHMAIWVALFAAMLGSNFVGKGHAGGDPAFWSRACSQDLRNGCRNWTHLQRESCREGSAADCDALGSRLRAGEGVARDVVSAAKSFARACDLELASGCDHLTGLLAADGARALDDACRARDGLGCFILGLAFEAGAGVSPDPSRAFELFRSACDRELAPGCGEMAEGYLWGEGVAVDRPRAAEGFRKACQGGHGPSCSNLGVMLRNGTGVPRDEERARELFRTACQLGTAAACDWAEGKPGQNPPES